VSGRPRGRGVDATGRSIGDGKHVRLHRWLLQSEAWRGLSLGGRAAVVEMYDLFRGDNNGQVFMSARELGRRLGVRKDTAAGYLWDCEAAGFIRAHQRGAFTWKERHATAWVLTEFPFAGAPGTKDFMRWRKGDVLTTRARPGTRAKSRTRARKAGQAVPVTGTDAKSDCPSWHDNRDRLSQTAPHAGPENRDTDSLPGSGVQAAEVGKRGEPQQLGDARIAARPAPREHRCRVGTPGAPAGPRL
jgi:hypothetical protein